MPVVVTVLLAACAPAPEQTPVGTPPDLPTLAVEARAVVAQRQWDGVAEAVDTATVTAQTSGRLIDVAVDVGDRVRAGDLLLRLADVEQKSAVRQAEAQLRVASVEARESQHDFERISTLVERRLVARQQFDQARARRDGARAALDAAQAAVAAAAEQLEYTVVRAPYDGVVTARHVEVGESVQPGQPLLSGFGAGRWRVAVVLPEGEARALADSGAATLQLPVRGGTQAVTARDITVFPSADPASHTVTVRIAAPTDAPRVAPGTTVKVAFAGATQARILVPRTAVVRRSELAAVYVVLEDDVLLRQVRLGSAHGDAIAIDAGLLAGDRVVVDAARAAAWVSAQRQARTP